MLLLKNKPLYTRASAFILEKIKKKEFVGTLPSEEHLSKLLNVSKNTVREALAELTLQGIICKRHGIGNVIMESCLNTTCRIDTNLDFLSIIEKSGRKAEIHHSFSEIKDVTLPFLPSDKYLTYQKFTCADGFPACITDVYVKVSFFKGNFPPEDLPKPSMFTFIETYTKEVIAHSLVFFDSAVVDDFLSNAFSLPINTSILSWREVLYTLDDTPICYTKIYFHPSFFAPTMIRKGFLNDESVNNVKCNVSEKININKL